MIPCVFCKVEMEVFRHENMRFHEEVEILKGQVEELANLKRIAEKNLEEALEALQVCLLSYLLFCFSRLFVKKELHSYILNVIKPFKN